MILRPTAAPKQTAAKSERAHNTFLCGSFARLTMPQRARNSVDNRNLQN